MFRTGSAALRVGSDGFRTGSTLFRVGSTSFRTGSTLFWVGSDVFRTGSALLRAVGESVLPSSPHPRHKTAKRGRKIRPEACAALDILGGEVGGG